MVPVGESQPEGGGVKTAPGGEAEVVRSRGRGRRWVPR